MLEKYLVGMFALIFKKIDTSKYIWLKKKKEQIKIE